MNRLQRFLARLAGVNVPSEVQRLNAETIASLLGPSGVLRTSRSDVNIAAIRDHMAAHARPGIRPPSDPETEGWTWETWKRCMTDNAIPGWTPCRFGNRAGYDGNSVGFVFGAVRRDLGLWMTPLPVCDDIEETILEPTLVACMTYIPSGMGVGIFHDTATAAKAAELAEPILAGMKADDASDEPDWLSRKGRLHETWRFHGIREAEHRHAHSGGADELAIWMQTAANMLEGKPEKPS